jgi:hypothetical protein
VTVSGTTGGPARLRWEVLGSRFGGEPFRLGDGGVCAETVRLAVETDEVVDSASSEGWPGLPLLLAIIEETAPGERIEAEGREEAVEEK